MLTPRDAPSLLAMYDIFSHGFAGGVLNPVVIVAYNNQSQRQIPGACTDNPTCAH